MPIKEDRRHTPTYTMAEVSWYLGLPRSTVRAWVRGQGDFRPLISRPDAAASELSFINVVEIHVLSAIRRVHRVPLQRVRRALDYIQEQLGQEHPLAAVEFRTNGIDLFVRWFDEADQLVNLSQSGQLAMRRVLEAYLQRVDRDMAGVASRLFPFTRPGHGNGHPRVVVIDPRMCFGRPSIIDTGVSTEIVAERYKAGESIDDLVSDYGLERQLVEEAIRCELPAKAA